MLKGKLLSKKHSFWNMIDSNLKFWFILFSIVFVVAAMPIILGSIPYIYKFLILLGDDAPKTVPVGFWPRYEAGFMAFIIILMTLLVSYFICINLFNLIWVLIAKTILTIRYTRLPLTEEEFNTAFKDMDFLQVMDELNRYMSFTRRSMDLEVVPIIINNRFTDDIYKQLFILIYNKFKDKFEDYWADIDNSSEKISNIVGWNIRCRMRFETHYPEYFLEHFNIFEKS